MATRQPHTSTQHAEPRGTHNLNPWDPFATAQKRPDSAAQTNSMETKASPSGRSNQPHFASAAPTITAPSGGGALKSIGEKFEANPITGTGSLSVPFDISPGRNGLTPDVSLSYCSGGGNGPFGIGWELSLPSITRKTAKGLPRYNDDVESDVFMLPGIEDLVPKMTRSSGGELKYLETVRGDWTVREYWPRTEGAFTRIERWSKQGNPADTYWRTISTSNTTSLYGHTANSKILDSSTGRVFAWLPCANYDSWGNAVQFSYKEEDSVGMLLEQAHESHRTTECRSRNRYIKSIKYGNIKPNRDEDWNVQPVDNKGWMFEVVFDYGDHTGDHPTATPDKAWPVRQDPFSTYVAGFEVRTYRLCRRLLFFHHLKEELGVEDCLVRSMDLSFNESQAVTILSSVSESSHALDTSNKYVKRSTPPIEFDYSMVDLSTASISTVPSSALANLPVGLSSPFNWVDLDGTGKPSSLFTHDSGWYYMKNLSSYQPSYHDPSAGVGEVMFGFAELLTQAPCPGSGESAEFVDLDGSGRLTLVMEELGQHGFFERTDEDGWTEFKAFPSWPTVNTKDRNCRYLDLTGDGLADIVIAEVDTFLWYPALGTEGYGEGTRTFTGETDDDGPRLLFSDGLETIFLADFSGDGLVDLVRIRNGNICYWPNIGYGRFGAKITMDNAPWMDTQDSFNQGRVQLTDIDGDGVTDLLYFPPEGGLKVFFNQAGNGFSSAVDVPFPMLDRFSQINSFDLFGLGLSSVVWSTTLPNSRSLSLQYLDFTHGIKPYLLRGYRNGPVETRMEYTSSVKFYQADELLGRPWPTRLPFPIHCLTQVSTYDYLSRTYHASRFAYHDGYYDGLEREFRGFGKVESTASEHFLLERSSSTFPYPSELRGLTSPPTLQVSWYHTGTYEGWEKARNLWKSEYYSGSGLSEISVSLQDPVLDPTWSPAEVRQAYRALKGTALHTESFLLDGSDKEHIPFSINDDNSSVTMLQRAVGNQPGVFLVTPRESVVCQVERNPADPRIKHELTLETDGFGNITKSVTVAYGRRSSHRTALHTADDWKAQGTTVVTYTEQGYTNSISTADEYLSPASAQTRAYEVTGLSLGPSLVTFDELSPAKIRELPPKDYTDESETAGLRLIAYEQIRYRANDLSEILGPGMLESLAIPGQDFLLAMTTDVVQTAFQSSRSHPLLTDLSILGDISENGGGYVNLENDGSWWVPLGQAKFSPDANATAEQELATARASFFSPMCYIDPFGHRDTVSYDKYFLSPVETVDAVGNTVTAVIDYRTLQPRLLTDANGNQTACAFDVFGACVGTAVMGKPTAPLGDTLDSFQPFLGPATIRELMSDPLGMMQSVLADSTSFSFSDFPSQCPDGVWSPGFDISVARDKSVAVVKAGGGPAKLQLSISYFDGHGQLMQQKTLASIEPGPEQWITSDCQIVNASSAIVRQYDTVFDASHAFSRPSDSGAVFSTNFYDPAGRLVATVFPNHTWTKNIYECWSQTAYDPGDNVLVTNPRADPDVGSYLSGLEDDTLLLPIWYSTLKKSASPIDRRTAKLCTAYADTPSSQWFDVLGYQLLCITDNGAAGKYISRSRRDVQGRVRKVIDTEGRLVTVSNYDLVGKCVYTASMEAGETWNLNDIYGSQIRSWNSRGIQGSLSYDKLRRPTTCCIKMGDAPEFTAQTFVYGEYQVDPEANNLRGKLYQVRDQAVLTTYKRYDHLENAIQGAQQFVTEYKNVVDWSSSVAMEDEEFTWSATFDALGRLLTKTRTDGSVISNAWDQRGLLASVHAERQPGKDGAVVKDIQYNARGQRVAVSFGNGTTSRFEYDSKTFWTLSKWTGRGGVALQDLHYTLDCVGKIVRIDDFSQQDIFFRGEVVPSTKEFVYDANGRLTKATGREHLGQTDKNWTCIPSSAYAGSRTASPSDGKAMARYTEEYAYSSEGNILSVVHSLTDNTIPGWTRTYEYTEPSLLEPDKNNNRLSSTTVGNSVSTYKYDGSNGKVGLITSMSGFPVLQWDFNGCLAASSTQVATNGGTPETTWYRYDSSNQRVRKVTERYAAPGETPVRARDHLYVNEAEVEVFRKYDGSGSAMASERWSWHVHGGDSRVVLVEANRVPNADSNGFEQVVTRYMVSDHLCSISLELDDTGKLISLEEYAPYGATTYDATANLKIQKRYRFSAKERDKETGFYYFENRYLMPWLGRWLSPDPIGTGDGLNVYCYVGCDPVNRADPNGLNQFILIPLNGDFKIRNLKGEIIHVPDFTDPLTGETTALHAELEAERSKLVALRANGRCELIVQYLDPASNVKTIEHFDNVPREHHAEEEVFHRLGHKNIQVYSMLISLEPCHSGRYPGHRCIDFFNETGRILIHGRRPISHRFIPHQKYTPIFYVESQTAKGQSSLTISRMRKAGPQSTVGYTGGFNGLLTGRLDKRYRLNIGGEVHEAVSFIRQDKLPSETVLRLVLTIKGRYWSSRGVSSAKYAYIKRELERRGSPVQIWREVYPKLLKNAQAQSRYNVYKHAPYSTRKLSD